MKINRRLLALLVVILLLGVVAGGAIYYFLLMPNPENNRIRSVGGVTPESLSLRPGLTWSNDEVELWSEGSTNLSDTIQAVLGSGIRLLPGGSSAGSNSSAGNSSNSNYVGASKVKIVVLPSVSMAAITEQTGVFMQKDVAIYSANFVYFPAEASLLLRNPDRLMDNLVAGLQYASAFKDTPTTQGSVYDISASGLLASYLKDIGVSPATGEQKVWTSPYPEKSSEYSKVSEVCFEIGSYLELMLCEAALQLNGNQAQIPPKSSAFFEARGQQSFASFKALGRLAPNEIRSQISQLGLSESKIKFNNWGFNDMEAASYLIANDGYYKNLNQEKLDSVKAVISSLGFELSEESTKVPNTQFGGQSNFLKYRKNMPIGDILVSVRVLDTGSLSSDCIVEGVGELFCTDDAIAKNSGFFIQIIVGEKLKYA